MTLWIKKRTCFSRARGEGYMSVFLREYEGGGVRIRFGVMRTAQQGLWFEHQDPKNCCFLTKVFVNHFYRKMARNTKQTHAHIIIFASAETKT